MFFSRITINAQSVNPDELVRLIQGDAYTIHQLLWRLFPEDPDAKRDFQFRREDSCGWPYFYMVSERKPQSIKNLVRIESKPYQPKLSKGQELSFSLRVNPVVTKKSDDGKKQVRHDVVMNAKKERAITPIGKTGASSGEIQYQAGIKWLENRAPKLGFSFDPDLIKVFGYQQHRIRKRHAKNDIQFSVLDYKGVLSVTDSDQFCRTLLYGIGPAKAFGCGLMLVKRI